MNEVSAGGVVVFGNTLLLLKKFNGDYVLPKGRVEKGESLEEAALREVEEESGVKASIEGYIGQAKYKYKNYKHNEMVTKTVHWYLMTTNSMEKVPQKSEGFIDVVFAHIDKASHMVKYDDEREIIKKGLDLLNSNC